MVEPPPRFANVNQPDSGATFGRNYIIFSYMSYTTFWGGGWRLKKILNPACFLRPRPYDDPIEDNAAFGKSTSPYQPVVHQRLRTVDDDDFRTPTQHRDNSPSASRPIESGRMPPGGATIRRRRRSRSSRRVGRSRRSRRPSRCRPLVREATRRRRRMSRSR